MAQLNFVTYCTANFIIYAQALIDSVKKHHPLSQVFIIPLDEASLNLLKSVYAGQPSIMVLNNSEIVGLMQKYQSQGRSFAESVYSVKPEIIQSAYSLLQEKDLLLYCDSDMYFFADFPTDFFQQASVLIFEHIFAPDNIQNVKYGRYNAGLIGFRKNAVGANVLNWWRQKCRENCSTVLTTDTFSDQKYLEYFTNISDSVVVVRDVSLNQSMWMIEDDSIIEFGPKVNRKLIVCFHFHGLRAYTDLIYTDLFRYGVPKAKRLIFKFIYKPYLNTLGRYYSQSGSFLAKKRLSPSSLLRFRFLYRRWP